MSKANKFTQLTELLQHCTLESVDGGGGELYVLTIKKQDNSSNQEEDTDEIGRNNRRPSDTEDKRI